MLHALLALGSLAFPLALVPEEPLPAAPGERTLTEDDLGGLAWRSIGPANMGGRVAAIALAPNDPKTIFIGFATGGVWKSENNGTTFAPIFDDVRETSSIGSIAVAAAPEDWAPAGWAPEKDGAVYDDLVVWVGTGEGNGRNSSSWGHGVYRSIDGGKCFEHVGLADSHDIPAIAVDPRDPDVCYVAALGHLWGSNEMRGVYKTTDGGTTWRAVLQIDDRTGACDVIIDPKDPDTVYAAMYDRRRWKWGYRSGGPEGGIYRSRNGGRRWKKLTEGLPAQTGRIGLDVHRDDPRILYAVIESDDGGRIKDEWTNRSRAGGVFRSDDGGKTWRRASDFAPRSFYFSRVRVDPVDPDRVYLLGWGVYVSNDGGRTFRADLGQVMHVDFHALVIDPDDTDRLLAGNDGGFYMSWDRGKTWDFHNHMAAGQFYNVAVDDSDPYRVGGGLQDNGSWVGTAESRYDASGWMGRTGGISNQEWRAVWGGDGFHVVFDPTDPNVVFAEWQGGNLARIDLETGEHAELKPAAKEGQPRFRFNWNAPVLVSAHDPSVLYFGGNHVFKMTERGDGWTAISPDLSRNEVDRIRSAGSEAETYGTVVSLAESPLEAGVLWAGTDDGRIHVTVDDGATWRDVTPDEVGGRYVSKLEASRRDAKTAYAAIDGHRSDSFEPIVLRTGNVGRSWKSIAGNLPDGEPAKVIREDPHNPDVLYVGTERACYVTIVGGVQWVRLNGKSLPPVAVDDLVIQPREMDLVAGTHGRSIWVLDDTSAISRLTPEIVGSDFHVLEPLPGRPRYRMEYDGLWSDRLFVADNPPVGAMIHYWIGAYRPDEVKIVIEDASGHVVRKLDGSNRVGLNRVVWDLQADEKQRIGNPHDLPEFVTPGDYRVKVEHGEHEGETTLNVQAVRGGA